MSDSDTSLEIAADVSVGELTHVQHVQGIGEDTENKVYIHSVIEPEEEVIEQNGITELEPFLDIVEQPQARGFRFRYPCEGASHGGIQGDKSERGKKTFPAVKVHNFTGDVRIMVRLVTNEKEIRPHAHELIGKNCKDGKCSVQLRNSSTMTASFPNLGIQHVTKKKVVCVLTNRIIENMKMQKLLAHGGGVLEQISLTLEEEHEAKKDAEEQAKSMQLNVVRLCVEAFLVNTQGYITRRLNPVISNPIYDSKAPGAGALKICRMDRMAGCCTGGEEVFLLCDKVQKDDVAVRFYEEDVDGELKWEGFGCFGPADVHRQYAIVFKTPPYRDTQIERTVHVQVQLKRLSDGEHSDPKPFTYFPQSIDKEEVARKRKKKIFPFMGSSYHGAPGGPYGGSRGDGNSKSGGGGNSKMFSGAFQQVNRGSQGTEQPTDVETIDLETCDSGVVPSANESDLAPLIRASLNTASGITMDTDSHDMDEDNKENAAEMHLRNRMAMLNVSDDDDEEWETAYSSSFEYITTDSDQESMHSINQNMNKQAKGSPIMVPYATTVNLALGLADGLQEFASTGDITYLLMLLRQLMPNQDTSGDNVLHLAVIHSQPIALQVLLKVISTLPYHNIVNQTNTLKQTPLHLAILTDEPETVEALMTHGANPMMRDLQGNTPFHAAAMYDRVSCLRAMVPRRWFGRDAPESLPGIDIMNYEGYTALHIATRKGHTDCMKLLFLGGTDPDIGDGTSGRTSLHHAVQADNLPAIGCLLLEGQVDVNVASFDGNTALHIAVANRKLSTVALLMAAEADPHVANFDHPLEEEEEELGPIRDGVTSMDIAHLVGDVQITRVLGGEAFATVTGTRSPHTEAMTSFTDSEISGTSLLGNMGKLDMSARMKLSRLLDVEQPGSDWIQLAKSLGLSSFINPLKGMKSPTRALLDNFEALDGTIDQLREGLRLLNRTDAMKILNVAVNTPDHRQEQKEAVRHISSAIPMKNDNYPSVDEGIDTLSVNAVAPPTIPGVNG